ncbi:MAG: CpsB/CapC family capsule biosynthesis tyrosine phosphatase [Solirubrobacteraceae bacterium]|nr:CpsB/CapC family capsule biosynthesis tyrosine phosphatase [Patulibacter sp.]
MSGFVDLHCHLLPALDDGPATDALAVDLARALVADGVTTVAATPHRTATFITPLDELIERRAALDRLLHEHGVELEVIHGAEVAVNALVDMDATELAALRLGGSGPLLVEFPRADAFGDPSWPVRELMDAGVPVLIAHPERIALFQQDLAPLRDLVERGAHAQVTSGALIGRFGRTAQSSALDMIDHGLVDVIASDAHHGELRPPETSAALAWLAEYRPNVDGAALAVHTPRVLIPPQAQAS